MPRIAFYSHDTMGLGHVRRNLLLAEALTSRDPSTTVLVISGVHVGGAFRMPPNVDCITLPAFAKNDEDGAYGSRHLGVPLTRLTHLRTRTTRAALLAFDPDLVVVDNVPRGAMGEAEPALAALKSRGRARLVLGLRDVLDEPEAVTREWRRLGHHEAIARYYDQVWVYGDPRVYDIVREYAFRHSTASKVRYVGYLDRRRTEIIDDGDETLASLPREFALCMTGGGQDGSELAIAFAQAHVEGLPRVLMGGPFLPERTRHALRTFAADGSNLHVVDFSAHPECLIERAVRVVTMGGYNSVCEALAYRKAMLIVPREWPRREQTIRAARLAELGLADVMRPSEVSPDALRRWFGARRKTPPVDGVCFNGLDRVPELVAELLAESTASNLPSAGGRSAAAH
jgi:predicted glycosyltransferase